MSARAACRLETLGFAEVYDYVAGKVDWLVHERPVEGSRAGEPTVGVFARDDVVTCAPTDRAGDVRERVAGSPYPFALIISQGRVLLGRAPMSALEARPDAAIEEVMDPGPSTVRPHKTAEGVASDLKQKELRWAIVTTPEGELIGVATRTELEAAVSEPG